MLAALRASADEVASAGINPPSWRGRLIIPWRNSYGRVATIAARTTVGDDPKYLYLRGAPLPPFYRPGRRHGPDPALGLVVVEGLIDALLLKHMGVGNVVATGGTAVSDRHVEWLVASKTRRLVLALDADDAGRLATRRLIGLLAQGDPEIRIQVVPADAFDGTKDPAELVVRDGPAAASRLLDARLPQLVWEAADAIGVVTPSSSIGARRDALEAVAGNRFACRWARPYCRP